MINTNFSPNNVNWFGAGNNFFGGSQNAMFPGVSNQVFGNNTSGTSSNFRANLLELSRTADMMRASLNHMRGLGRDADSPFGAIRAISSDTDILNISSVSANRMRNANLSDFTVDVVQMAQAQRNEGTALNANTLATAAGFEVGSHHIALHVGDRQFDINFTVSATDTARDVQQRIANAINTRNVGVEASVSVNAGSSTLALQSAETGVAAADQPNFTVSSSAGNALAVTGIGTITQQAQNAQFRVNRGFTGALQTSRTNDVDLGFGITAQLREEGTAEITLGRDETRQINAFRHMVNSFNDLMNAARDASGSRGGALERELAGMARSASASLSRVGISINQDGLMRIDEDRMQAAFERGELERFAMRDRVGSNFGFMNQLTRTADRVARNPGAFVRDDSNPMNTGGLNFNAGQLAQMNRFMNLGMLFETNM
jgi:hypothetical protein